MHDCRNLIIWHERRQCTCNLQCTRCSRLSWGSCKEGAGTPAEAALLGGALAPQVDWLLQSCRRLEGVPAGLEGCGRGLLAGSSGTPLPSSQSSSQWYQSEVCRETFMRHRLLLFYKICNLHTLRWLVMQVGGRPLVPGAAFFDMAASAAATLLPSSPAAALSDITVPAPLAMQTQSKLPVETRIDCLTGAIEIASAAGKQVHCRASARQLTPGVTLLL